MSPSPFTPATSFQRFVYPIYRRALEGDASAYAEVAGMLDECRSMLEKCKLSTPGIDKRSKKAEAPAVRLARQALEMIELIRTGEFRRRDAKLALQASALSPLADESLLEWKALGWKLLNAHRDVFREDMEKAGGYGFRRKLKKVKPSLVRWYSAAESRTSVPKETTAEWAKVQGIGKSIGRAMINEARREYNKAVDRCWLKPKRGEKLKRNSPRRVGTSGRP